jgi:hypothetical protein
MIKNHTLILSSKYVFNALLIIASLLIFASVAGQVMKYIFGRPTVYGLVHLFNVNHEQNIPTLFSVILLLACAGLLGLISYFQHMQKVELSMYWAILSLGFIYMAIDEFTELHEKLSNHITPLIGDHSGGFFQFSWVIPALILVIFLGIFFLKFLLHLPKKTRVAFIIAGMVYLIGLIGIEMPGGYYAALHGGTNLTYSLITTLEESLEMLGLILFIRALIDYLSTHFSEISINFQR